MKASEITPADRLAFAERQQRGCDRHARMKEGAQMRVVEIKHVRGEAVDERRVQRVRALAPAEHRALIAGGEWEQRGERLVDRGGASRRRRNRSSSAASAPRGAPLRISVCGGDGITRERARCRRGISRHEFLWP
jgi:hypothetical protein